MSACARAACALPAAAASRSCSTVARLSDAVVAHAHASPMHRARNSGRTRWPLEFKVHQYWWFVACVQITSYNMEVGSRAQRGSKVGVSGPAEDLRPVSEVEAGVNFRPAAVYGGRLQVHFPGGNQCTGTRQVRGGAVTPSLHPEVPGTRFASPGRGLGIRQSMGWTKVCDRTVGDLGAKG